MIQIVVGYVVDSLLIKFIRRDSNSFLPWSDWSEHWWVYWGGKGPREPPNNFCNFHVFFGENLLNSTLTLLSGLPPNSSIWENLRLANAENDPSVLKLINLYWLQGAMVLLHNIVLILGRVYPHTGSRCIYGSCCKQKCWIGHFVHCQGFLSSFH